MFRTTLLVLLLVSMGFLLSCKDPKDPVNPPPPEVPRAPTLFAILSVTQTTINLSWNDQSEDEDGFTVQVYAEAGSDWITQASVGPHTGVGTVAHTLSDLSPGTPYRLRVVAFNEVGNSAPSNEQLRSTTAAPLPHAPSNIDAEALASVTVRVTWQDNDNVDAFAIQRHAAGDTWVELGTVADGIVVYLDNTVSALTTYYYRVGARNENGTAWSADSAEVTTPVPGAPLTPDSLQATVFMGQRVTLKWVDRSVDETGFELKRGPYGELPQPLAMLGPNVVQYVDELGPHPGINNYQLRAFNTLGASSWVTITVDYRYCSFGVIPLCTGNSWDYLISDTVGADYELHMEALTPEFLEGLDWYAISVTRLGTHESDTLHYWRNTDGIGTYELEFPAPTPPAGELLYHWPALLESYTVINGDSVQLTSTGTAVEGRTAAGADTTFTNCISFEYRYHGTNRRDHVYIHPYDIGIVKVIQYQGGGSDIVGTRDLIRWDIEREQ